MGATLRPTPVARWHLHKALQVQVYDRVQLINTKNTITTTSIITTTSRITRIIPSVRGTIVCLGALHRNNANQACPLIAQLQSTIACPKCDIIKQ